MSNSRKPKPRSLSDQPANLQGRIDTIRKSNQDRADKLATDGIGIAPQAELYLVIDLLVQQEIERNPEFPLAVEQARAELLTEAEQHVARTKLGITPPHTQLSLGDIKR